MAKKEDKQAEDVFEQQYETEGSVTPVEEAKEESTDTLKEEQAKPNAKKTKGKPPPYVGANDVSKKNLENAKFQNLHVKDESIVTPQGHSQYFCKYNCANGQYVRGRTYTLRDNDPLVLALDKYGRGKFFKKL